MQRRALVDGGGVSGCQVDEAVVEGGGQLDPMTPPLDPPLNHVFQPRQELNQEQIHKSIGDTFISYRYNEMSVCKNLSNIKGKWLYELRIGIQRIVTAYSRDQRYKRSSHFCRVM